jgi:hypothetical protein
VEENPSVLSLNASGSKTRGKYFGFHHGLPTANNVSTMPDYGIQFANWIFEKSQKDEFF